MDAETLLFGCETEYAVAAEPEHQEAGSPRCGPLIIDAVRELSPWMRDLSSANGGVYLGNGARLYLDQGNVVEYCTPECTEIVELVAHSLAGDHLLERAARRVMEVHGVDVQIFRNNVCYASGRRRGCHLNMLLKSESSRKLVAGLWSHWSSKVIYGGNGGFDPFHPGARFVLCQRGAQATTPNGIATDGLGILSLDRGFSESLSGVDGHNRLHDVSGPSNLTSRSRFLQWGPTILLAALIDQGKRPPAVGVPPSWELAHSRFVRDPEMIVRMMSENGSGGPTALEIQLRLLRFYRRNLDRLPDWADALCDELEAVLSVISRHDFDSDEIRDLDWPLKRRLFGAFLAEKGWSWGRLDEMNRLIGDLTRSGPLEAIAELGTGLRFSKLKEIMANSPALRKRVVASGIDEEELEFFLRDIRDPLLEMDIRFGQLGERGLLAALNGANSIVRNDGVPGLDRSSIRRALESPPRKTRASIRGRIVKKHSGGDFRCDWNRIIDPSEGRELVTGDPFGTRQGGWRPVERPAERARVRIGQARRIGVADRIQTGLRLYDWGRFRNAARFFLRIEDQVREETGQFDEYWRYRGWSFMRWGDLAGAEEALRRRWEAGSACDNGFAEILDHCVANRHLGLSPRSEVWEWIGRGIDRLRQLGERRPAVFRRASFFANYGYCLAAGRGAPVKGLSRLRKAVALSENALHPFPRVRLFCDMARVLLMTNEPEESAEWLARAEQICRTQGYGSELSDGVLLLRARSSRSASEAQAAVTEALAIQRKATVGNYMGELRSQLIAARLAGATDPHVERRLRRIRRIRHLRQPILAGDPLLQKILGNWQLWIGREPDPELQSADPEWWCV